MRSSFCADTVRYAIKKNPKLLSVWVVLLTIFGSLTIPWEKPKLTDVDITKCEAVLQPGDIVGVESERFVTGRVLPKGKWNVEHSAIYVGNGELVEAVTPCVRLIAAKDFFKLYDRVVIVRPRYSNGGDEKACSAARKFVGIKYDVLFENGVERLYCHETCKESMASGGVIVGKEGDCYLFDDLAMSGDVVLEIGDR